MCMAVDETTSKNKTSVSLAVVSATIILLIFHLGVATAEQQDKGVVMEGCNKDHGTKKNMERLGSLDTGGLDARRRDAPAMPQAGSSSWGQWRLFDAGAHEVPSGPNPISN